MSGIEDIYNVVNRIAAVPEDMPQEAIEESAYDTLENVVQSIRTDQRASSHVSLPSPSGVSNTERFRDSNSISPEPPQRPVASIPPGVQNSTVSSVIM